LVETVGGWTHQTSPAYLSVFVEQIVIPKKTSPATIREKYLKSSLSASQLAEELGVSKQMVLQRLRAEGVRATVKGRGADNFRLPTPPFGYRVVASRLVPHPGEMKIARLVVELRDRKGLTWGEVARGVNHRGFRSRAGTPWNKFTIRPVHKRWTGKL
jgi:biotin operon repressor